MLTETVWALAHQREPIVPDQIEVITTASGKAALTKAVLDGSPSVMDRLKAALCKEKIDVEGKLVFGSASIKVIPDAKGNELDDLRTGDDNLKAADFMLDELRKYSECSDTTIHCSIAGGRKTMSALLFSCMSLVGREQDKVYHVLVPPEFEGGVEPVFYFAEPGKTYVAAKTGKKYKANQVQSELFEVPFVRMRGWYQEKFNEKNLPTYKTLIERMQSIAPRAVSYPAVTIDAWNGEVQVDGDSVRLKGYAFAVLLMLANGESRLDEIYKKMCKLVRLDVDCECAWLDKIQLDCGIKDDTRKFAKYDESKWREQNQEISKILNPLRDKLRKNGFKDPKSLVPVDNNSVTFPIDKINWLGRDEFKRISGDIVFC